MPDVSEFDVTSPMFCIFPFIVLRSQSSRFASAQQRRRFTEQLLQYPTPALQIATSLSLMVRVGPS